MIDANRSLVSARMLIGRALKLVAPNVGQRHIILSDIFRNRIEAVSGNDVTGKNSRPWCAGGRSGTASGRNGADAAAAVLQNGRSRRIGQGAGKRRGVVEHTIAF